MPGVILRLAGCDNDNNPEHIRIKPGNGGSAGSLEMSGTALKRATYALVASGSQAPYQESAVPMMGSAVRR
jgi:hypothetical protein